MNHTIEPFLADFHNAINLQTRSQITTTIKIKAMSQIETPSPSEILEINFVASSSFVAKNNSSIYLPQKIKGKLV